jgi:hypothetical protein
MTQKSRAAILTEIGSLLADNTSQDITPSDVRSVVQDINDSFMLNTSLTRSALQALISGVTVEVNSMYTVTNAVGATKVIVVFGKTTSTISTLAINLTDNTFGSYDISGDTFTVGTSTLADVLDLGNTSGLNDIVFDATYGLEFDNSSRLREGTIDAGLGGSKGVAQICGAGYELKWEGGRLYVMGSSGNTIRQSLYNLTTTPTVTDDDTLGYSVGSLWTLDDGTIYRCTDASTGDAVWVIASTVTFKKSFNAADTLGGGTFDITELAAPGAGYAWQVTSASAKYTFVSTANDNLIVNIRSDSASSTKTQFDDQGVLANVAQNSFIAMIATTPTNSNPNIYENDKIVIDIDASATGNGTLIVYGTARLITL